MMRKYILINEKTPGFIALGYNPKGYLIEWRMCCWDLKEEGLRALLQKMGHFLYAGDLKEYVKGIGELHLQPVDNDLRFERFWEAYGMKRNVDKAKPLWEKMDAETRQFVLWNIEAYHRYIRRVNEHKAWYNQLYPDTYLRNNWREDWDKIEKPNNELKK